MRRSRREQAHGFGHAAGAVSAGLGPHAQILLVRLLVVTKTSGYNYAILEEGIREYPTAWVFPFYSVEFVATRDQHKLVMGIGPIVVKRKTGESIMGPPLRFNHFLEQHLAEDGTVPDAAL